MASRKFDIKFDRPLLDKVFCRRLERGLSSTYVVQEIRHLLRTGVPDEELITEVTKASAAERERIAVQNKGKGSFKVNQVQQDDTTSKLLTAVESLTAQLAALKQEFGDLKKGSVNSRRYVCGDCKCSGVQNCNHCFKCGSTDHIGRNCRNSSSNRAGSGQGN